jgi:hypothetical protein
MANLTITEQLEAAKKKYEEQAKQLATETAQIINSAKTELSDALKTAADIYLAIPETERKGVLSGEDVIKSLATLGLKKRGSSKGKSSGKGKGSKVSDQELIDFLKQEKGKSAIEEQFKLSSVTVGGRLGELVQAGKISERKDGVKKFWKAK